MAQFQVAHCYLFEEANENCYAIELAIVSFAFSAQMLYDPLIAKIVLSVIHSLLARVKETDSCLIFHLCSTCE